MMGSGTGAGELISLFATRALFDSELSDLFSQIAGIGREVFEADFAVLWVRDPTTGRFDPSPVVAGSISDVERATLTPPRPGGLSQELVTRRLVAVEDLRGGLSEEQQSTFTRVADVASFAAVAMPATGDQETLCILYLDYRRRRTFGDDEKAQLRTFADQAALVLRSRFSFDGLRRVRETGERLTRALDSPDVLSDAVTAIREAAAADLVVLYPVGPGSRGLSTPTVSGELVNPARPPDPAPEGLSIPARMLETGEALFLHDASTLYETLGVPTGDGHDLFIAREEIRSVAALPIAVGDDQVGVLFVSYRRRQEFDAAQVEVIHGLASYAAIAIRNSAAFRALRERELRRLQLLRGMGRDIRETPDLEHLLHDILARSASEVGAEEASILLYDSRWQDLATIAAVGPHAEKSRSQRISLSDLPGITRWVFEHGEPVRVDDLRTDPRWKKLHVAVAPDIVSELDIPLKHGTDVLGVMNFESTVPGAFTPTEQDFLVTFAESAVLDILREEEAVERALRTFNERASITEVLRMIAARERLEDIFEFILGQALKLTGAYAGELMLVRSERGMLECVAGLGGDTERQFQPMDVGIIGWVMETGQPFSGDILEAPWKALYQEVLPATRSEMTVPLRSGGAVVGVLDVESREAQAFDQDDQRLLEDLAELAVVAIRHDAAERDAQTQLERFRALYDAGRELGSITGDLETAERQAYETVTRIAASAHPSADVVIRRWDPRSRGLVRASWKSAWGTTPFEEMPVDEESLNAQVFHERRTLVVHDTLAPPEDVRTIKPSDDGTRTLLITPILIAHDGGREASYFGNLALAHHEAYHFLDTDRELFAGLAQLLALTLQRLELSESLVDYKERAKATALVTSMNLGAAELAHRLTRELTAAPVCLRHIEDTMEAARLLEGEVRTSLDLVREATTTVLGLGQSMQEKASSFEAGENTEVPLYAALDEIAAAERLPGSITLVVHPSPQGGVMIQMASKQIVSIVRELIRNASDATVGADRIEIYAEVLDGHVEIFCRDTGRGVPEDRREKIFRPFYSTKRSSGLGLWMAQLLAQTAGGDLELADTGPAGTTFMVRLPASPSVHASRAGGTP